MARRPRSASVRHGKSDKERSTAYPLPRGWCPYVSVSNTWCLGGGGDRMCLVVVVMVVVVDSEKYSVAFQKYSVQEAVPRLVPQYCGVCSVCTNPAEHASGRLPPATATSTWPPSASLPACIHRRRCYAKLAMRFTAYVSKDRIASLWIRSYHQDPYREAHSGAIGQGRSVHCQS
jgi:hypothetical protein